MNRLPFLLLASLLPALALAGGGLKRPQADALLGVDEAFALLPPERNGSQLHLEWNIAPGYYLYRHRLAVEWLVPRSAPTTLSLPTGEARTDEHFGAVEVYHGLLAADLPLGPAAGQALHLRVRYQGCAEVGVCYPPQTREFTLPAPRKP